MKFECPNCKNKQTAVKKDKVFWCEGCSRQLLDNVTVEQYGWPIGIGHKKQLKRAIKGNRLMVG